MKINQEIILGIIGAGRIAKVHIENIKSSYNGIRIKTVADPYITSETAQWLKGKNIEHIEKNADSIFNDREIHAILICSSTDTHAFYTKKGAIASKHIFCEKPLDHNLQRIQETLHLVEKAGIKFQIGFNRRFDHNFAAVKEAIVRGEVGNVHIIKITSRDPEPPNFEYLQKSGGMFLDMTIHDFDMVRYLSDSEVDEVYAVGAALADSTIKQAGDIDTALITLKLTNGAMAVIDNSRQAVYGYDQRVEVFGSMGAAAISNDTPSTMALSTKQGVRMEKPQYFFLERYMNSFKEEIKQFVNSILENKKTPLGSLDALQPVKIALAAKESLETGLPVKIQ